ncbi:acyl carrier protein [Noviherbaspirillum pedocola]|uniref:Acyl carrier protein n=1 Tax=Noviherbaspirillum pedocola TaxID=2801341 RepID=A0A934W5H1_9BURK|nr:acyl carrier protein [Noviherbaspirillum pedocola]MBK4733213.1 acyl carrier protein [Noviherbaspirillum pedocola]
MSDSETIIAVLKTLLRERYCIDAALESSSRLESLGIDSLHILDLLLDVEAELGIELGGLALPPHATLGQLADAIAGVHDRST